MADSIIPRSGFSVPIQQFAPARIDTTPPPAPPINNAAQAQAAMFSTIAAALGSLPGQIMGGLAAKRKEDIDKRKAEADILESQARAKYYGNGGAQGRAPQGQQTYETINRAFYTPGAVTPSVSPEATPQAPGMVPMIDPDVNPASTATLPANGAPSMIPATDAPAPGTLTMDGSVFSLVPDGKGGHMADPHDTIDAGVTGFSAQKGAWGHNIKDPALMGVALTPADLKKAGINPNDRNAVAAHQIEVIGPDGSPLLLDIVDKNGTEGRADFTLAAYRALGGPENRNGGIIPGLKMRVVPRGQAQASAVPPASVDMGNGARLDIPGEALTAGNAGAPAAVTTSETPFKLDLNPSAPGVTLPGANIAPAPSAAPSAAPLAALDPRTNFDASKPVRRPAMSKDPNSGIITVHSPGGNSYDVLPNGQIRASQAASAKAPEGVTFPNPDAARAAGMNPEGATLNPDGTITVKEYKPLGADDKGRGKITDSQKNKLSGSMAISKDFTELSEMHKKLYDDGKAGRQLGTIWQNVKKFMGDGDADFVTATGKLDISRFKVTRALNGAGVLTDKDFARAQTALPSIRENPEQFNAKLQVVKDYLIEDITAWIEVNADQATERQLAVAREAIQQLGGTPPSINGEESAPAAPAQVKTSVSSPAKVTTQAEYDALPTGAIYVDDSGIPKKKR